MRPCQVQGLQELHTRRRFPLKPRPMWWETGTVRRPPCPADSRHVGEAVPGPQPSAPSPADHRPTSQDQPNPQPMHKLRIHNEQSLSRIFLGQHIAQLPHTAGVIISL